MGACKLCRPQAPKGRLFMKNLSKIITILSICTLVIFCGGSLVMACDDGPGEPDGPSDDDGPSPGPGPGPSSDPDGSDPDRNGPGDGTGIIVPDCKDPWYWNITPCKEVDGK